MTMKIKGKNYLFFSIGFAFAFFIVLMFVFVYSGNYETFTNTITFLSKEETQSFIKQDSDSYINNLSIYDLRARNVTSNDEYLSIAINSCLDFNEIQKEKLKNCATEAIKYFNNNYNWTFALTNGTYEEGFPHTRGAVIFLSPMIVNYTENELTKTLIHESVHIYQRFNKPQINKYLILNGYTISRKKDSNSLIRANPDLDEYIYKDKNGNELIAYYNSEFPKGISDIRLTTISEEHPYEKMAYEYADIYMKSLMLRYKNV